MPSRQLIFTPLLLAALAFLVWDLVRKVRLVALGTPEHRWYGVGPALKNMLHYAFAQARVLRQGFGFNHFLIFWAFMALLLANGEFMLSGTFPSLRLSLLPDSLYLPIRAASDLISGITILAVVAALIRRTIAPPFREARSVESYTILLLVGLHMVGYLGVSAGEITLNEERAAAVMPLATALAGLFPADHAGAAALLNGFWWLHALALLTFIGVLIPFTKHLHVITAIINCALVRDSKPNTQPREEFQPETNYGAGQVDRLSWKDLLDAFACTKCGRCQQVCPATETGKLLNPRLLIDAIRHNLLTNGSALCAGQAPELALIGTAGSGSIPHAAIWACTSCGACMEECPVFIEHLPKLVKLRRHLVEMEANFPDELLNLFENLEQRSNPWGIAPSERSKWTTLLAAQPFVAGKTDYLFYVGCAGSFDNRNKHVTLAVATLLDKAGVSWGIIGKEELCCGDSARRLGNEFLFEKMATKNVELFKTKGVIKIITQCPHCFSTVKNDYRQYGLELQVQHHSEVLAELIAAGKLPLQVAPAGITLLHDSCYLGRHNDVYAPPRAIIAAATGAQTGEFHRHGKNAFCCGAGGGRMWMEEDPASRINDARVQEALTRNPATICVACPYCLTMFEDGLKNTDSPDVRVKDIAELLVERI